MTKIFDIDLYNGKYIDLFSKITKLEKQNIVFTPNPEILLKTLEDKEFKKLLEKANFLTIDGIGIYIAFQIINFNLVKNNFLNKFFSLLALPYFFFNLFFKKNMLYNKYGERICGSDLTKDLINFCIKNNIKITIIDPYRPNDLAKINSQKNFRKNLEKKFPTLKFDFIIYKETEKENIINKIKNSESKILFSTLGMKSQEESIIEIMKKAENIKLGLGVGSSFDYFIGFQKRAPKFLREIGLEWLYRLITGPQKFKRIKRIYNAIFVFIFKVYKTK